MGIMCMHGPRVQMRKLFGNGIVVKSTQSIQTMNAPKYECPFAGHTLCSVIFDLLMTTT